MLVNLVRCMVVHGGSHVSCHAMVVHAMSCHGSGQIWFLLFHGFMVVHGGSWRFMVVHAMVLHEWFMVVHCVSLYMVVHGGSCQGGLHRSMVVMVGFSALLG